MASMFAQFLQGPPNPAVAAGLQHGIDLNHQAMALSRQGDHAGAAELHRRALQHKLNHHGTGNITTAVSFNALGEELMHLDRLDEAEENIKQALEIAIKLHSTSDQGFYRENLAMVYEMKGDLDKARTTRHENAPDKFVCANYACQPLQLHTLGDMSQCSRCRSILYCSKPCQRRDWARHKQHCVAAQ